MFRNPRSKVFFIKGLMTYSLFPIFFGLLILFDVFFGNGAKERQNMEALQERGVQTAGCIIQRDIPNVTMGRGGYRHRLIFEFQTPQGAYTHGIRVPEAYYEEMHLGDCLNMVYLPEDPSINEFQYEIDTFSSERYWSEFFAALGFMALWVCIGIAVLSFVLYLLSWLKR